ncbi:hypothetical protein KORDIASMS9_03424 [Kordia sp. SMS9]|uniref:hypothetical protein n=1 Tax=Kordia sp. SMS9 TaxID=2282170 RepID=UPI000E0DDE10|nr:hypothetical protein [Kordia sp. SMS9]AXG71169.1 hypothetical protein KORDIASMS9_03424 [Kordia sp. SMS9]
METTYTNWKIATIRTLEDKTAMLDASLQKKVEVDYFKRLLEKMATHAASQEALSTFQTQMDAYVEAIPSQADFKDKDIRRNFIKKKAKIKNTAVTKHKLVNKGFYMSIWMPLGLAIGMPWGIAFGNIALGLPFGLAFGLAIGSWLDSKAAKEGRVV